MKVRALVLTLISGSLLAAPAYAQLGGVVGSATQAGGSLGNTGLGVDHTLNGTLDAGRDGLNGDLNSVTQAKAKTGDLDKAAKKAMKEQKEAEKKARKERKEADKKAKQSANESKAKSLDVLADGHAKTESTVDRVQDVKAPVNASSDVNASGDAKHSRSDSSLQLNSGSNTTVNAAGVGVNAATDSQASAEAKSEPRADAGKKNANSGDGKLLDLDRAGSRVDNATALQKLDRNEKTQDEKRDSRPEVRGEANSQSHASGHARAPRRK